jgi:hypothetical protein
MAITDDKSTLPMQSALHSGEADHMLPVQSVSNTYSAEYILSQAANWGERQATMDKSGGNHDTS